MIQRISMKIEENSGVKVAEGEKISNFLKKFRIIHENAKKSDAQQSDGKIFFRHP